MSQLTGKQIEELREGLRPTWYATRRGRRRAVALGAAALGCLWVSAAVCWFLAPSDTAMWTTFTLAAIGLVTYAFVFRVLVAATQGVVGLADHDLDERQLAQRRHVYALAHRVSLWMLLVAAVLAGLLPDRGDHFLEVPSAAVVLFMGSILTSHLIAPHLVAGWVMPDSPQDDD
ncbi:hypothetical protein [Sphaerisporangium sp. TRM90804]|uniref:hypothetical protein n=1 Tax=Sphaerisporangium sp. TRM90804 TaxID=3031113 RepID=UPI002447C364|nr:hypothetical protein [Sphaerisporangium sp. TRM90804]MDH2424897.1 hypothetical protein [Sphaerisporangium sp. TRM90804]